MRSQRFVISLLLALLALINVNISAAYKVDDAIDYADEWWGQTSLENQNKWKIYNTWHNTNNGIDNIAEPGIYDHSRYYNHYVRPVSATATKYYTDCAHFVSQCLIAGGLRADIRGYNRAISYVGEGNTNHTLRDYGGLVFGQGSNDHNPSDPYITSILPCNPPYTLNVVYSQTKNNNDWSVIVNTRPRTVGLYDNELSLFAYLLHQYHAQYFYGQRPDCLEPGDVYFPTIKHVAIVNRPSVSVKTITF